MNKSAELLKLSEQLIVGGVNSPVRAFRGVGGTPLFFERGKGAYLFDVDGGCYVDYVCSWGALIVGHAHPAVVAAVQQAATQGLGFGTPTETEYNFAEAISSAIPSMELTRAVSSGTEATMSAIRLARGFSGRDGIIKFSGGYHGHVDSMLVAAGSGSLTLGISSSKGVPAAAVSNTWVLPYNDTQAVADIFANKGDNIAAVIVEPVAGNMNMVMPADGFLQSLRELCDKHGALLIFDEVMTGFRVAAGGAQQHFGIKPDITCLGKVIGGGLNVAAFGGRADIMRRLAPVGDVYQAGTLSGNPLALTAGLATLEIVLSDGFFEELNKTTASLTAALKSAADDAGVPFCVRRLGGMWGFNFCATSPQNLDEVAECDITAFQKFFHAMLKRGIYLAPSAYEAGFISSCHGEEEIIATALAAKESFVEILEDKS